MNDAEDECFCEDAIGPCAHCSDNRSAAEVFTLTDRVVLDVDEAQRIAGQLEELYYKTEESAYDITSEDAAEDAMMLRDRGGIEPNPELIDDV